MKKDVMVLLPEMYRQKECRILPKSIAELFFLLVIKDNCTFPVKYLVEKGEALTLLEYSKLYTYVMLVDEIEDKYNELIEKEIKVSAENISESEFILDALFSKIEKKLGEWQDATEKEKEILKKLFSYGIVDNYAIYNSIEKLSKKYNILKKEVKDLLERFLDFYFGL